VSEPRTHYQISLTARQALGLFVALLVALGLAYFFGLMTGLSGRESRGASEAPAQAALAEPTAAPAEPAVPPVETGVPISARGASAGATTPPPEPTVPATLQTFEDAPEGEGAAAAATPGPASRTTVVGVPASAPAKGPASKPAAAASSTAARRR
jgi:hypothetical protein